MKKSMLSFLPCSRLCHAKILFSVMLSYIILAGFSTSKLDSDSYPSSFVLNPDLVQSGGLVFRRVSGAGSDFVDRVDVNSHFSHVGIVYVPVSGKDVVFVIHVQPQGLELVQLDSMDVFLQDATDFAIYKPSDNIADAGVLAARQALGWVGKKKFDREFNLDTDDELYCTELIYKAYQEVGVDIVNGELNVVEFPFVQVKEAIYPSLLIESDKFILVQSNENKEVQ